VVNMRNVKKIMVIMAVFFMVFLSGCLDENSNDDQENVLDNVYLSIAHDNSTHTNNSIGLRVTIENRNDKDIHLNDDIIHGLSVINIENKSDSHYSEEIIGRTFNRILYADVKSPGKLTCFFVLSNSTELRPYKIQFFLEYGEETLESNIIFFNTTMKYSYWVDC